MGCGSLPASASELSGSDAVRRSPHPRLRVADSVSRIKRLGERLRNSITRDLPIAGEEGESALEPGTIGPIDALDLRPYLCLRHEHRSSWIQEWHEPETLRPLFSVRQPSSIPRS